jgi:hypothetical protein
MDITASESIAAGTLMKRPAAPQEEFVVLVDGIKAGDDCATVRYFGSGSGRTWTERTADLVRPKFHAVAF